VRHCELTQTLDEIGYDNRDGRGARGEARAAAHEQEAVEEDACFWLVDSVTSRHPARLGVGVPCS
jgi:hypothetical protein